MHFNFVCQNDKKSTFIVVEPFLWWTVGELNWQCKKLGSWAGP